MKKNLFRAALTVALTVAMSSQAFAAYIVAPPENASSSEFIDWFNEECKRWEDRVISENADTIRQIEDPVERINAVVKAVAGYSTYGLMDTVHLSFRFEAGQLDPNTLARYAHLLGKEVGLDIHSVSNMYSTNLTATSYCIIDGVDYWFDVYGYDIAHEDKYLARAGQPEWVLTQEQLNANHVDAEIDLTPRVMPDGQVVTFVD